MEHTFGMVVLTISMMVIDGAFSTLGIVKINNYVSSVVSKDTRELRDIADFLQAWQDLHNTK